MDARGRTWCIDCALAAAGVKTSGRSGRSAASYRRRINQLAGTTIAAREIDLREPAAAMAAPRPSQLVRDLRVGRRSSTPAGPSTRGAPVGPEPAERLADPADVSAPAPPPPPPPAPGGATAVAPLVDAPVAATPPESLRRSPAGSPARARLKPVPRLSDIVSPPSEDSYRT